MNLGAVQLLAERRAQKNAALTTGQRTWSSNEWLEADNLVKTFSILYIAFSAANGVEVI